MKITKVQGQPFILAKNLLLKKKNKKNKRKYLHVIPPSIPSLALHLYSLFPRPGNSKPLTGDQKPNLHFLSIEMLATPLISINRPIISRHSTPNSNSLSYSFNKTPRFPSRIAKVPNTNGGRSSTILACSTSYPFLGKVGLHRREGNFTLLSFGSNTDGGSEVALKSDVSQVLSGLLPFVVALTAVAALVQPLSFTW